jgi:membrane-bound lytic murein transglycosylase D
VVAGDNLSRIAKKNNVTVEQLQIWNNLEANSRLFARQKLVLFTPASVNNLVTSQEATAKPEVKIQLASLRKSTSKKALPSVKKTHTVQPNDTLWSISRRYNDIPVEKIKKLNKLKNNSLRPGMKLVIS